jgi:hypothetical protein
VLLTAASLAFAGGGPAVAGTQPSPEPSPAATAGTTWALRPATSEGPDGRISLRHVIQGGGQDPDTVALTNFGERPATFAVYASDGVVGTDGNFDILASGKEPVDSGTWITISPVEGSTPRDGGGQLVEVAGGATVLLPVQIAVPADATPGDHPAGIVAELAQADNGGVQLASRVGVRVHLRVAGDIVADLVPRNVTATYHPSWNPFGRGTVTVRFDVANEGNVRLGAQTDVSAAGPWGIARGSASASEREVLPGTSASTTVTIAVAPLFFTWGDVAVTPSVVGEDDVDATLSAASLSFTAWTVPWAQLALVLLVVGAFVMVRVLRRRNAARVQARIDAAVAAAVATKTEA